MKRKKFKVTCNGKAVIKYAWNTATKEVLNSVKRIAKNTNKEFSLVKSESLKNEDGDHFEGVRIWETRGGYQLKFTIKQVV